MNLLVVSTFNHQVIYLFTRIGQDDILLINVHRDLGKSNMTTGKFPHR
jgi:hypothetical protein